MKPKVAVIVQRYGDDVLGGSEEHCRKMVNLFKDIYDITVLTSTAKDYITWANHFTPGEDRVDGVPVIRFEVKKERNIEEFNRFSEGFFASPPEERDEEKWFDDQGPYIPELPDYISTHKDDFDCFIFMTYLYYNTANGLPLVPEKSVLVSTAHDEPPLYLNKIRYIFENTSSIIFNTESERKMIFRVHPDTQKNNVIGGYYIDHPDLSKFHKRPLQDKYILYFGRLERGKGIFELFDNFLMLNSEFPELKLVCLGRRSSEIHFRHNVIFPGFVSEEEKWNYIKHSEFVVMPSPHESLSITLLEGLTAGKPVLVNSKCDVLVDHVRKGNCGLYYSNYAEFVEASRILLGNSKEKRLMSDNAIKYIDKYYSRESMFNAYKEGIEIVLKKKTLS